MPTASDPDDSQSTARHTGRQPAPGVDAGRVAGVHAPPPGTPLTREQVVAAAVALIDADGVEGLTMRRLAQCLGRDPMRLYRHAAGKAELLDAVTEHLLTGLQVPAVHNGDWQSALRTTAHRYRDIALAHPRIVPLLVIRPLATPLGLRPLGTLQPLEDILALLIDAGFAPHDALHVYRMLFGFLQGHILNEVQELIENPDENDDVLRLGLHRLPLRDFPHIRSLATTLATYNGTDELTQGLDILLAGLSSQLNPR